MASIEFIQKRIAGKESEIQKLQKKIARIEKAKETNWEVNPYYYQEYDLKVAYRDLEDAEKALNGYREELTKTQEKAASRNVEIIVRFLDMWKARCIQFYQSLYQDYVEALNLWYASEHKFIEWWNSGAARRDPNRKEIEEAHREERRAFHEKWGFLEYYVEGRGKSMKLRLDKIDKDLTEEANRKYDFIIERTNEIVGQITDASALRIGDKGDLNGFIKGTRGTAKVETIGAGGYNIQRFHFRTLIKPVK